MPTPNDDNALDPRDGHAPFDTSTSHGAKSGDATAPDAPSSQDTAEESIGAQPASDSQADLSSPAEKGEPSHLESQPGEEGFSAADEAGSPEEDEESSAASKLKAVAGSAVDGARKAAGALGQETASGLSAFKAVNQAKRAHAQARGRLEELKSSIESRTQEVEHRQDVEARYDQIINENSEVIEESLASIASLEEEQEAAQEQEAQLQEALDKLKAKNAKDLRPYEKLARNAKASSEDAARALSGAKRDLKAAQNSLRDLIGRRDSRVSAAHKAVDNSRQRLNRLQGDLSDLQHDDEATPQQLADLRAEITAEMARLSKAQEDAQVAPNESSASISAAERQVDEAQRRLEGAQEAADSAKREAKKQAHTLEGMEDAAKSAEQAAEDEVIEVQKHLKTLKAQLAQTAKTKEEAEQAIAEANDIHHTPEKTQELLEQLADDNAAAVLQQAQVDSLAADEHELRQRTRTSRIAFILVVAAAIIVLLVLFLVFFGGKGA